ncbi:MAG TPA: hypothetical protein VLW86_12360 [Syntrophorhabdales bacterium]|nr:hypothetical protein [Syntrophorhabdales bacterium]
MDAFTTMLRCPRCEGNFPVELSRMRLNYPNYCPSCGSSYEISIDQAIRAHRLLERLESTKRIPGPVGSVERRGISP